jgi:hypothetical protein
MGKECGYEADLVCFATDRHLGALDFVLTMQVYE